MSDGLKAISYWEGDPSDIADFLADWKSAGIPMTTMGLEEAADCVREVAPGAEELFRRIRIAACRSDVARLAFMVRDGGLYVDVHTGLPHLQALLDAHQTLDTHELIGFVTQRKPGGPEKEALINGAICARPRAPQLEFVLADVLANLREQEAIEAGSEAHSPFNVAALTGAWVMKLRWVHIGLETVILQDAVADRIALRRIADAPHPFEFYRHYSYRRKGVHWSERQLHEPLFERRV